MRSCDPVTKPLISYVTAQTDAVRIDRGAMREGNDFCDIAATLYVQAPGTVAGFALDALLRMIGMPETIGHISVTCRAGLASNRGGSRNLYITCKRVDYMRLLCS